MKPCCVCVLFGVAVGMMSASYLMLSNKKFKDFVKQSKTTIEKKVQELQENQEASEE